MKHMGNFAIKLTNLTRDFSIGLRGYKLRALDQVNLEVPSGGIFGLLGPNGSGKSTTIKIILGLLRPSTGRCDIFGVPAGRREARSRIGYLPENPFFYQFLTGRELVRFFAAISGLHGQSMEQRVDAVLETVRMIGSADRRIRTYSKGMIQRIGLAQALVHDPDILILDEPMSGLDPIGTCEVIEILRDLRDRGKTVLLASHLLARVEEICDEIAILHKGQIVCHGSLPEIIQASESTFLKLAHLSPEKEKAAQEALRLIGINILEIQKDRRRLDEVFLAAVSDQSQHT
jgi:ABC-2 type transport system ATP-binding protein